MASLANGLAGVVRKLATSWPVQAMNGGGQAFKKNIVVYPSRAGLAMKDVSPFLFLAEDWVNERGGFETHPHRGFETVTICFEGAMRHEDSKGNSGVLEPGDCQFMTAGHGVQHSEMPVVQNGKAHVHITQLWVNLPAKHKLMAPRYQDLRGKAMPRITADGVDIVLYSGSLGGQTAPTKNVIPVIVALARLAPAASYTFVYPAEYNGFVYVLEGEAIVGGAIVASGHSGLLPPAGAPGEPSSLEARSMGPVPLVMQFCAGVPIDEPVAHSGPFVMNTEAEVRQAYRDYQEGKF